MQQKLLFQFVLVLFLSFSITQISAQRLSVGLIGGMSNHELFFEWINPVTVLSQSTPRWETPHYGLTGRYKLYQGLSIRSDLYYMQSSSDFVASYKVKDTKWIADASFKQSTIHLSFTPQINFGPMRMLYVYGGFMYEINSGSDFEKGNFTTISGSGPSDVQSFKDDQVINTVNPAAVVGLGINPRFGRYGFLLDARFTRSRAEAVHKLVPRIGRENWAYSVGFTYDLIEE
jgi:hypothetical protein